MSAGAQVVDLGHIEGDPEAAYATRCIEAPLPDIDGHPMYVDLAVYSDFVEMDISAGILTIHGELSAEFARALGRELIAAAWAAETAKEAS